MIEIDGVQEALWNTRHPDASFFASCYEDVIAFSTAPAVTPDEVRSYNQSRTELVEHGAVVRFLLARSALYEVFEDVMKQVDNCLLDRYLSDRNTMVCGPGGLAAPVFYPGEQRPKRF